MDIKFDADEAMRLIKDMDRYCSGIQREAKGLLRIVNDSEEWNDKQKRAFKVNVDEMANDLSAALKQEVEYMRTYYQRVQELRG